MQTVLYITPAGVQYWRKSAGNWQPCDGVQAGALWVVTNLAEESTAEISVPRLFGNDRRNFIQRQLSSRFPDTPFCSVLAQPASGSLMTRLAPPRQTLFGLDAAQRVNAALDDVALIPVAGVWASTLLLWQMSCYKSLPKELFVVLPGPDALRIVFIKNHLPVLSRLVPGITEVADQAAEITRTVRYLENNHLLARSTEAHNVLLLDSQTDIDPLLAQERLTRVPVPSPWTKKPPADWRFALFDLAVKSPAGQLAPLARRTRFMANHLRPKVDVVAGLCVVTALWVAAGNFKDIISTYTNQAQTQQRIDLLTAQSHVVAQKISGFGVSPERVRSAVQLVQNELDSEPSLADHMRQISVVISALEPVRLRQFDWRIFSAGEAVCTDGAAVSTTTAAQAVPEPNGSKRRVEVSFEVVWPEGQGVRARNQGISNLSANLAALNGAHLIIDPAQALALSAFSGGEGASAKSTQPLVWCLTLSETLSANANAIATDARQP